jgi:GH43 family beta-xylosidase
MNTWFAFSFSDQKKKKEDVIHLRKREVTAIVETPIYNGNNTTRYKAKNTIREKRQHLQKITSLYTTTGSRNTIVYYPSVLLIPIVNTLIVCY